MLTFLAHALIVLAAWTVTIKYLFPIAFALAEGVPLATYVYWDLWPVAHVWMAWALLVRPHPRYTFALAVGRKDLAEEETDKVVKIGPAEPQAVAEAPVAAAI